MIRNNGYHAEEHTVKTTDGYWLTLHRIPHEKHSHCLNELKPTTECKKPVVFLQHGLLGSSADYIISGPEQGLAYILADAGYDVWLGNFRGNTYSRRHATISPESPSFWQFSWHEMGVKDLPEMIDYVLQQTSQRQLDYIGHSQGTTTFLVMTSTKPEYNIKIRSAHLMAPLAFMSHMRSPLIRTIARIPMVKEKIEEQIGTGEFSPSADFISQAEQLFCKSHAASQEMCSNAMFLLAGFDSEELNVTLVAEILKRYPAGASIHQLLHYTQEVSSGKFCQYDQGMAANMIKYGVAKPTSYPLNEIRAPISLYYAHNDMLAALDDVEKLKEKLRDNVKYEYLVPHPKWNHIDFLWANDARKVVYEKIVENMKRVVVGV